LRDAGGDLPGAIRHYEKAVVADRESQAAAFALGEALHRSGQHRRAAESLAAALVNAPPTDNSPWFAYHRGFGRGHALLQPPPAPAPMAAGAEAGGTP
jgi:hypothetical protein